MSPNPQNGAAVKKFIADLHTHSHFSIATSPNLTPEYLDYWAQLKGIDVVGTGDCIHPGWLHELRKKLLPCGNGLYRLKEEYKLPKHEFYLPPKTSRNVYFILTGEISSIYKKAGKVRKVHSLCLFPDFAGVEEFQKRVAKLGNIQSDGRPILGVDAKDILAMTLAAAGTAFVIPAHIWTPWFSVLGAKSGFDTLEACYEDLTKYIFAVETGLSSDPPMNWACSFLDACRLVSNSDAHSPEKLGREANIFETEISYAGIYEALKNDKGFLGTVEFFPQEGKYHYDGHRKCNTCWDPVETVRHNGICPNCHKPVTKGVLYRVAELADRADTNNAKNRKEFYSITSLPSLIAEIVGAGPTAKKVQLAYFDVLDKVGADFYVLLSADIRDLRKQQGDIFAEGIRRLREREVHVQEGFDGEFGAITVFTPKELANLRGGNTFSFLSQCQTENKTKDSVDFDINTFKKILKEAPAGEALPEKETYLLHDEQADAIAHGRGVGMVIAGPGSGKTHILTQRIIRLIQEEHVSPENILAITFSNKAAQEIQNRVKGMIPFLNADICTFHAFGLSIMKKHHCLFKRSENFTIMDEDDSQALCVNLLKDAKKKLKALADYKQGMSTENDIRDFSDQFDAILQKHDAFALDDLIFLPVQLFSKNKTILDEYRSRYYWVLIDEYQDINPRQYELVRLLLGEGNPNLFVIGDPDQAIYGFRGSDVRFIKSLQQDYPEAKTVHLSRSYRCPSPVLKIAGQALQKKEYLTGNPVEIKIEIKECDNEKSEADIIASQIEKMVGGVRSFSLDSGTSDGDAFRGIDSLSNFAVLCRVSSMFEPIAAALQRRGIPHQCIASETWYEADPYYTILKKFKRSLHSPEEDPTLNNLINRKESIPFILSTLLEGVVTDEDAQKCFLGLGADFGNNYTEFFRNLALRKGIDDLDIKKEAVSLLTLHASKGLEFAAVFIAGCEDTIIPFELYGKKSDEALKEEERLFYVGATRTKRYLFLTYAKKRVFQCRSLLQQKSRLLDRLENNLLHSESIKMKEKNLDAQTFLFDLSNIDPNMVQSNRKKN